MEPVQRRLGRRPDGAAVDQAGAGEPVKRCHRDVVAYRARQEEPVRLSIFRNISNATTHRVADARQADWTAANFDAAVVGRKDSGKRVLASSLRRAPRSPVRPRISPKRKVRSTSANSPRRPRPRASTAISPGLPGVSVYAASSRPTMSCTTASADVRAAGRVLILRPSRSTVIWSATWKTSPNLWLT